MVKCKKCAAMEKQHYQEVKMSSFQYRIKILMKYKDLIMELVSRDLKLKYRRSFLGYIWSILNPLLVMLVLTLVFSRMFNKDIENYPVFLLCGRILYDFLKQSTNNAMKSVTGNAQLLKKTYVPQYVFTLAKVTSCMVDTVLSLGALAIVMIITGAEFYWTALLFPVVIIQIYIFCCGLGFLLATLHVFFRDIRYIYNAVMTAWLYLTPIIYPLGRIPEEVQFFVKNFNPLYFYVEQFRAYVYSGTFPSERIFWSGWVCAFAMLIIGVTAFRCKKDKFILYI